MTTSHDAGREALVAYLANPPLGGNHHVGSQYAIDRMKEAARLLADEATRPPAQAGAASGDAERSALENIAAAVQVNENDTMGSHMPDSLVVWLGEGSWEAAKPVTLGDLRHLTARVRRQKADEEAARFRHLLSPRTDAENAAPSAPATEAGARYRHVKRGTEYEVIGHGKMQCAANPAIDDAIVVIYRGEDGALWVRGYAEFHDGRFTPTDQVKDAGKGGGA